MKVFKSPFYLLNWVCIYCICFTFKNICLHEPIVIFLYYRVFYHLDISSECLHLFPSVPVRPIWQRWRRWSVFSERPRLRSRGSLSTGYCARSNQSLLCIMMSCFWWFLHCVAYAGTWDGDAEAGFGRGAEKKGGAGETNAGGDGQEAETSRERGEAQGETNRGKLDLFFTINLM